MSTTVAPPRQPKYAPKSEGGRYIEKQYTDPGISLSNGRTTFSGYDLRKYRVAGQGPVSIQWTATIYRDGQEAVVVVDDGDGTGARFTGLGPNMNRAAQEVAAFRWRADELYAGEADAVERFAVTLQFSAEIDRHARTNGITRPEAVWDKVQSGELDASEAPLFINGYLES